MGATSAFHEGGAHLALRTGKLAGELAASGRLEAYNPAWKRAVGEEIRRNVAMADLVAPFGPADWDGAFRVARRLVEGSSGQPISAINGLRAAGLDGLRLAIGYRRRKLRYRGDRYVQIREAEYAV